MNPSLPSNSDDAAATAWASLHPKVQHWIWKQNWTELRDVQARAIAPILAGRDVILAAPTAGGKTEAAFLPIASALAGDPAGSFRALYIGPLKALINDQCDRLESLCGAAGIDVHKRHGDASMLRKAAALKNPTGVLLTTPESLEALFVIHGSRLAAFFAKLAYVVVDELHAFIGEERGRQVQTQLHRLELLLRRRVPRVGLSATLGDMALAAAALRPGAGAEVEIVQARSEGAEVRILIRGVEELRRPSAGTPEGDADDPELLGVLQPVADDLFRKLRGSDNLVFANSRARIERLADLLRNASEKAGVRNEFLPHHGGLAKELRQDVERDLKSKDVHLTAVCTSTLEMGIDIGAVESVAQVGPPPSVASLKQRIGRSGRRAGQPQILRGYTLEDECDGKSLLRSALRLSTVQFCAMTGLMLERWTEPPRAGVLHLSTLVQQTLSVLAQTGGARADDLWRALCATGPFREVSAADFAEFLRSLASFELVRQLHDDSLFLDLAGERMVEHFDFYAAFQAVDEWRLVADGRGIGTTSISTPMTVGEHLLFAGRRWRIEHVAPEERVVTLAPSKGRRDTVGELDGPLVHDRVRQRMREIYFGGEVPRYLDERAAKLLQQGRAEFMRRGLFERSLIRDGNGTTFVLWRGGVTVNTVVLVLRHEGLMVDSTTDPLIEVEEVDADKIAAAVRRAVERGPADPIALTAGVENLRREKHDAFVPEALMRRDYAARMIDAEAAWHALKELVDSGDL